MQITLRVWMAGMAGADDYLLADGSGQPLEAVAW